MIDPGSKKMCEFVEKWWTNLIRPLVKFILDMVHVDFFSFSFWNSGP